MGTQGMEDDGENYEESSDLPGRRRAWRPKFKGSGKHGSTALATSHESGERLVATRERTWDDSPVG